MKAHKIDLKDYEVERGKLVNGSTEINKEKYGIKEIIANIMCHPSLKHKGFRFHTIAQVATKIEKCKEDFIILDSKDYEIVKECFDSFQGYGKNDREMVARIYNVEEIEMEVKKND